MRRLVGGLQNSALDYTASGMCLGNKRVILYLFRCKRSVSGKRKEKVNVWSELLRLPDPRILLRAWRYVEKRDT